MCGIVGYIGPKPAAPILISGLKKLEYRGYDSAGIAVIEDSHIKITKSVGKIANLEEKLAGVILNATTGIGHTRWATHGKPSDENAHPHLDCTGKFAVVHNGIIENYLDLKEELMAEGHTFRSETDTEVLAHLLEKYYAGDLLEAVIKLQKRLHGSYAAAFLALEEPGRIVAVRKDSPLIVGLGDGENFLASDIPAILNHTRKTYILQDGEIAELTANTVKVYDMEGNPVAKEIYEVTWNAEEAEKGGYAHFMQKEIFEQPKALRDTLAGRLDAENLEVKLPEIEENLEFYKSLNRIFISACGTAYHAGLVGKYLLEKLVRIPVEVDVASEFRYRDPLIGRNDLLVVISQSGETADTLAALREAKKRGARVLAVTNVVGSSVSREADDVIYTWAGPEIAVASTKAYTTQLLVMYLFALYLGRVKGTIDEKLYKEMVFGLKEIPQKVQEVLEAEDKVIEFAKKHLNKEDAFFIGRGLDFAVSLEGQLKLKEISYIHAEAYAAGELKHGTLALIVKDVPVIALATQEALFEKMLSNIKEVNAREATILGIAFAGKKEIAKVTDEQIYLPRVPELLAPILAVVPLQLLAYHMAVLRGNDVDKPRNLAKSVTVE
ncbi:glutamine--fructose-6-phosphate transaminase (isomerizing) [Carboxydothermus ferrireducens]|uniref:Glutamine--fructose-6-phosphate aminotransferase [isomerizing] n=1 Tax=Carboxydothermus ferrireducens DSM 11255 TaxID=1119529 RepID=A0ABX2RFR5_9THEO|nr:glutamine--fructose-6-phosphate transaminase (isomerizing) [Carboxydothermus ferrireducens]NYE58722.1 glucosamine--fructose-6-phosphate aminotransferase (isomerizing) [Carboxydothermus ferrireducens DSM 11255]